MTLTAGIRLGPYEVVSQIGAGGMGEVWLARDTKLDRDVAIKVLPEAMARDPERVARFEREAKLLASLSHPKIAAVHGFDETDGARFLVLEYVEGETLQYRLKRGAFSVEDTLEICRQIAEGLEAAHEKGVIHRDLKPGNVMVGPDGAVKVLDFGLAKALSEDSSGSVTMNSPTITADYTRPGVVLGTAAYMSPEQARGRPLDKRTDIWSFGVILFECLAGARLFAGDNATDSMGAILHKDPEWGLLPAGTPPTVRLLLQRCLAKDPNKRLHDIADARIELEDTLQKLSSGMLEMDVPIPKPARPVFWPVLAGVLALALIGVVGWQQLSPRSVAPTESAPLVVGMEQLTDLPGPQIEPSLSPNGKMMVYIDRDGGDSDIFLVRVGGENPINLTRDSTADEFTPAFSPDGESIAYRSEREGGGIFVMGATGESPRRVSDKGFHPAWSPDGRKIAYSTEYAFDAYTRQAVSQLWIVNLDSEKRRMIYEGDAVAHQWSPGGGRIAFWANTQGQRDIWTISSDGGDASQVTDDVETDWNPLWSADGRYLYFISDRGGSPDLWRVGIDEATGGTVGELQPVTTGIARVTGASISADGRRLAFTVSSTPSEILRYAFDPEKVETVGEPSIVYTSSNALVQMDVSADGEWIAYRTTAPRENIFVMRSDGTGRRRLTDDSFRNRGPRWSPDGKWLVFYTNRGGSYEAWIMRPDGTRLRCITDQPGEKAAIYNPIWSPDGKQIAGTRAGLAGASTVFFTLDGPIEEIDGPLQIEEQVIPGFTAYSWSPGGGHMMGIAVNELGDYSVAVYSFETDELKMLQVSDGGFLVAQYTERWLDENRVLFWARQPKKAHVFDAESGETRALDGLPGPGKLSFADEGRTLIVNLVGDESDVWVLNLSESAED